MIYNEKSKILLDVYQSLETRRVFGVIPTPLDQIQFSETNNREYGTVIKARHSHYFGAFSFSPFTDILITRGINGDSMIVTVSLGKEQVLEELIKETKLEIGDPPQNFFNKEGLAIIKHAQEESYESAKWASNSLMISLEEALGPIYYANFLKHHRNVPEEESLEIAKHRFLIEGKSKN